MKALVTGANGFTGSHLVKALEKKGFEVVGLVRKSSNLERLVDAKIKIIVGDITDQNALTEAMKGVDFVFHTAAYVELGIVDEIAMERANFEGTGAVLEAARSTKIKKMVYCSTIGIYGDTQGVAVNETFVRQQRDFSSAYDRTKYAAQELVDRAASEGFPVVSVMPSGIFAPDDPHFGPVIKLYLQKRLNFWVGSDRITGIVHVDDVVSGMLLALEKGTPGEHYILSAGDLPTREMFAILSQKTGIPIPQEVPKPLVYFLGNLLEPIGRLLRWNPPLGRERVHYLYERCVRVDAAKARQELGWQPRSIDSILQEFIQ